MEKIMDNTCTTQIVKSGYARSHDTYEFIPLTLDNWKERKEGYQWAALDRSGNLRHIKITSIKTWKTRPNVVVHWKYGLYEYGYTDITEHGMIGVTLGFARRTYQSESGQAAIFILLAFVAIVICLYLCYSAVSELAGTQSLFSTLLNGIAEVAK